jgi:hypothetical protein
MRATSIAAPMLVASIARCGTTFFGEQSIPLADVVIDGSGPGFSAAGEHFDACEDFCTRQLSIVSLDSCAGPALGDADGTGGQDAGAMADAGPDGPWFVTCSGTWQGTGCDAPYADW